MTSAPPSPGSTAEALNRSARRIFQALRQPEWGSAVIDAAAPFCGAVALFTVQGQRLQLERASFDVAAEVSVELAEAPAVAQALESREPVAAAWSSRELSPVLIDLFGGLKAGRAFLFPVTSSERASGVLISADPGAGLLDANGLELVATLAGAAWELRRRRNEAAGAASTGLITLGESMAHGHHQEEEAAPPKADGKSEWHQKARRFASVKVAELRLYHAAKVREGREARNLYDLFREAIEHERATFRAEFMEKSPSMVDYLHEELVRTLAQGEPDRMGENYPGAMVRS